MSDSPKSGKKKNLTAMRRSARSFALQALYSWHMAGQSLTDLDAQFRVEYDMRETDMQLFSELLHGVAARKSELDGEFGSFIDRAVDELDPIELTVLRIGTFELMQRIAVPYRVAINESVELSKKFGATDSHRYINGVLDKVAQHVRQAEVKAKR